MQGTKVNEWTSRLRSARKDDITLPGGGSGFYLPLRQAVVSREGETSNPNQEMLADLEKFALCGRVSREGIALLE